MRLKALVVLLLLALSADAASPADAVARAHQDIRTVPVYLQPVTRYLWVAKPSQRFRTVEKLRINLLSRYSEIVDFVQVEPWLWRLRLDEPKFDPGTWENAADTDPYFHLEVEFAKETTLLMVWPGGYSKHDGGKFVKRQKYTTTVPAGAKAIVGAPWLPSKELIALREMTWSEAPVLMAEWLFVQSSRQLNLLNQADSGIGYYDWLKLDTLDDYFQLIDPKSEFLKGSEIFGREYMAVLDRSGISDQNRQLFRYKARGGGVWATFDTNVQKGRGVAINNIRRPDLTKKDQTGRFDFNAQEWFASLPNRGPVMFLNAIVKDKDKKTFKAVRQNIAPGDTHGLHSSSLLNERNSKQLHILLDCLQCHWPNVLKPFEDDVRKRDKAGQWTFLAFTDPQEDLESRKLLKSDIYKPLADDEQKFVEFFEKATTTEDFPIGLTVSKAVQWYSRQFHWYATDPVDLKKAAAFLGVERDYWLKALRNYARPPELKGPSILAHIALSGYLLKEPAVLSILTFEDCYSMGQQVLAQQRERETREAKK